MSRLTRRAPSGGGVAVVVGVGVGVAPGVAEGVGDGQRRLAIIVAEYNARNQSSLTLDAWLQLHVREMAIGRDLAAAVAALTEQSQRQAEADLNAAAAAEKARLLELVS